MNVTTAATIMNVTTAATIMNVTMYVRGCRGCYILDITGQTSVSK